VKLWLDIEPVEVEVNCGFNAADALTGKITCIRIGGLLADGAEDEDGADAAPDELAFCSGFVAQPARTAREMAATNNFIQKSPIV
jgi:hypothetical protein